MRTERARGVLINRFAVAGFRWSDGPRLVARIRPGDPLELRPEPDNPHDRFAVVISWMRWKIGYVPRSDNRHMSRLLRRGIRLHAEVVQVDPAAPDWQKVRAAVYLEVEGRPVAPRVLTGVEIHGSAAWVGDPQGGTRGALRVVSRPRGGRPAWPR
jgi:MoxR-like ATPase